MRQTPCCTRTQGKCGTLLPGHLSGDLGLGHAVHALALAALLLWRAWPMMPTATVSRHGAAPQRWSCGDPLPRRSGDGGSSLGDGCVNDGWLHDGPVDHEHAPSHSWQSALDPPSTPKNTVTRAFLLQKIQVSLPIARRTLAAGVDDRPADSTDKSHRCFWGFPAQRA